MKVLLINGSPHRKGCTYTALNEVAKSLNEEGIETEIFHIGIESIRGCIACGQCKSTFRCVFKDGVNVAIEKMEECDGLIVGSPVYYASANGTLISFLDRMFYAAAKRMVYKPAAAVVSARRAGTTASFDQLNKYFMINNMPVVSSQYWNMVHGNNSEEVLHDEEGLQIMRRLGKNMAWLLKCIENGKEEGIVPSEAEAKKVTNFIR